MPQQRRRDTHCQQCDAPAGQYIRRKRNIPGTWRFADVAQAYSDAVWRPAELVELRPGRSGLCDHCWARLYDVVGDDEG